MFEFFFFISCMWVFHLHICLCTVYVQCLQKLEENIGSPGTELLVVVSYHVCGRNLTQVL